MGNAWLRSVHGLPQGRRSGAWRHRPWHPITWPEREIGWSVYDPAIEGTGIAREAAEAVRAWAYTTLGWTTAVSYIDPDNAASIRLAERLGCTLDEAAEKPEGEPCLVYRHPAPEALT